MHKYLVIFQISWQNEFVYRFNFILWRFRNLLRLLMTYFLWFSAFASTRIVYGYSREQMLTYVFLVLIIQTIVLSAPSSENIGGEIANGDLSNYLVKPISYLKYWFTRDLASKFLNISFAIFEICILYLLLRPQFQLPTNPVTWIAFTIISVISVFSYFFLNIITKSVSFWTPENTWGITFLMLVLIEILAGGIFPIDILPNWSQVAVQFTPFPYLIYYPVSIFLGKYHGLELFKILAQSISWMLILLFLTRKIWRRGLLSYSSEGK